MGVKLRFSVKLLYTILTDISFVVLFYKGGMISPTYLPTSHNIWAICGGLPTQDDHNE